MILAGFVLDKIKKEYDKTAALLKNAAENGDIQKTAEYERRMKFMRNLRRLMWNIYSERRSYGFGLSVRFKI